MDFCTDYALQQIAEWEQMAKDYPRESAACERVIRGWQDFIARSKYQQGRGPAGEGFPDGMQ